MMYSKNRAAIDSLKEDSRKFAFQISNNYFCSEYGN